MTDNFELINELNRLYPDLHPAAGIVLQDIDSTPLANELGIQKRAFVLVVSDALIKMQQRGEIGEFRAVIQTAAESLGNSSDDIQRKNQLECLAENAGSSKLPIDPNKQYIDYTRIK